MEQGKVIDKVCFNYPSPVLRLLQKDLLYAHPVRRLPWPLDARVVEQWQTEVINYS